MNVAAKTADTGSASAGLTASSVDSYRKNTVTSFLYRKTYFASLGSKALMAKYILDFTVSARLDTRRESRKPKEKPQSYSILLLQPSLPRIDVLPQVPSVGSLQSWCAIAYTFLPLSSKTILHLLVVSPQLRYWLANYSWVTLVHWRQVYRLRRSFAVNSAIALLDFYLLPSRSGMKIGKAAKPGWIEMHI